VHLVSQTDVHPSRPKLTLGLKLPTRKHNRAGSAKASLFGIAPDKAFLADVVTVIAGGLLHHHFTLAEESPKTQNRGLTTDLHQIRLSAVCFCGAGCALLHLPVRKYPALWCPDFPLPRRTRRPGSGHLVFPKRDESKKNNIYLYNMQLLFPAPL